MIQVSSKHNAWIMFWPVLVLRQGFLVSNPWIISQFFITLPGKTETINGHHTLCDWRNLPSLWPPKWRRTDHVPPRWAVRATRDTRALARLLLGEVEIGSRKCRVMLRQLTANVLRLRQYASADSRGIATLFVKLCLERWLVCRVCRSTVETTNSMRMYIDMWMTLMAGLLLDY